MIIVTNTIKLIMIIITNGSEFSRYDKWHATNTEINIIAIMTVRFLTFIFIMSH